MELIKKKIVTIGNSRGIIIPSEKIQKRKEIMVFLVNEQEQKEINRGGRL